jgi:hypothetical protein
MKVHKFHTDRLTSLETISKYLSRVAPLPFDKSKFSWGSKIQSYLEDVPGNRSHNLFINGKQIFNPYSDEFLITGKKTDKISEIDFVEFKNKDGNVFGKGWIAQTNFLGGLPKSVNMRGISVRQGNIEIGNSDYLTDYFTEPRFATWHVGAFHFDYSLRPNARRDGFEETNIYEMFLEQMTILGKQMSRACRSASVSRYNKQDLERSLAAIEKYIRGGIYVDKEHLQLSYKKVNELIMKFDMEFLKKNDPKLEKRILNLNKQLMKKNKKNKFISDLIDQRQIRHIHQTKLLEMTCHVILRHIKHDGLSKKVIAEVLSPFIKGKSYQKRIAQII